jgi:threonine dehydrogenase-like Zn-dependent dehydrogenase
MRAVIYGGKGSVKVENIDAPKLRSDTDVLVRVKAASICGTDVRLYWGTMNEMFGYEAGDAMGHEFVGVVEEVGKAVHNFKRGQRVVSPFSTHCGHCYYCERDHITHCEKLTAFGLGKQWGSLGGGQAELVCVPNADRTLLALDDRVSDEHATVLPDVLTGVFASFEGMRGGSSVAVLGCGPVGLASVMCARLLGAGPIFAIDHHENRLAIAAKLGAIPINFDKQDPVDAVKSQTGGRGADIAADTVGKVGSVNLAYPLVRPRGVLKMLGYIDPKEQIPIGPASLAHIILEPCLVPPIRRYQPRVMRLIADGKLDPTPLLSHTMPLSEAPQAYKMMADRLDGAIKIVLKP